ncbi:MAG: response regulator [Treponema sp.]|jgi:two-component system response regulator YesN|nr:response regulator [Treponema sp.]
MPLILIVDDEKNIRTGIRKILSESIAGLEFREAKNGVEALNCVLREMPNVVITDIRMPRMDGIALMASIREKTSGSGPKIIVLSGYDDFEYARKAITYHAVSYILKPVDRNELIACVSGIVFEAHKTRKSLVEKNVREFIIEGKLPESPFPLELSSGAPAFFALLIFSPRRSAGAVEDFLKVPECYRILQNEYSLLALVWGDKKLIPGACKAAGLMAAVSGACKSFSGLAAGRRQARITAWNRFFASAGNDGEGGWVMYYNEPEHPLNYSGAEDLLQKLTGCIGVAEADIVAQRLEDLVSLDDIPLENRGEYCFFLNEWLVSQALGVYWNYTVKDMYLSMKHIMIETPERFASFNEWKKHFSDFILYLHTLMRKERPRYDFIGEALAWIEAHFAEDINMTMAANQVSVNYTWFSEKFREQTGMYFNEYLNRLRIEKAKAMLESGCYMVYEAAELSGYQDVKYFQKVFKEISGVSPGEWRRQKKS